MYPELRVRIASLYQSLQATETDLEQIASIISGGEKQILKNLDDQSMKNQILLSISVLNSQQFESLSPKHISIKFISLCKLQNQISKELIEKELSETLNRIEDLIFEQDIQSYYLRKISNFHHIILDTKLLSSEKTQSFYSKRVSNLFNVRTFKNNVKQAIFQNNKNDLVFDEITFYFKKNKNIIEKLLVFVHSLPYNETVGDILNYIEKLNLESISKEVSIKHSAHDIQEIESIYSKKSLSIAMKLDTKILKIFKTETMNVVEHKMFDSAIVHFPYFDPQIFKFHEETDCFTTCSAIYMAHPTRKFVEFDLMFICMIKEFLIQFSDAYFFALFTYLIFNRSKSPNIFQKLHKKLKNLPDVIRSVIIESCFSLNDRDKALSILVFLHNFIIDPFAIIYKPLDSNDAKHFRMLLEKPLIKRVLLIFYKDGSDLNNILDEAIENITISDLPERMTGITLRTLSIVIKHFKSNYVDLVKGATFVVILHELAHYLQRANCKTIRESMTQFSPGITNKKNTQEGGYILEEELFGERLKLITLKQSMFLLEGNYPETFEEFREQFTRVSQIEDSNPSLPLLRGCNDMYLGTCGSVFTGPRVIRT